MTGTPCPTVDLPAEVILETGLNQVSPLDHFNDPDIKVEKQTANSEPETVNKPMISCKLRAELNSSELDELH